MKLQITFRRASKNWVRRLLSVLYNARKGARLQKSHCCRTVNMHDTFHGKTRITNLLRSLEGYKTRERTNGLPYTWTCENNAQEIDTDLHLSGSPTKILRIFILFSVSGYTGQSLHSPRYHPYNTGSRETTGSSCNFLHSPIPVNQFRTELPAHNHFRHVSP
jgi:hypothetical protein